MARSKNPANQDFNGKTYEENVAEIEQIINNIEAGNLDLATVFEQFTLAVESLQQCENFLQQRQKQVNLLIETLKDD
ncbi:MAG TPA: exodeoxyribonuclease VII small subunit [Nostocaceae cyanobacterium]|nr:exodeoxyribonuclease VII small subunit [Nostocaceae cyanobacterium]